MNSAKFENLVLAICEGIGGHITTTRLAKLLWLADKIAFRETGSKITDCRYIRKQFGPVPFENKDLLDIMREKGLISLRKTRDESYSRVEYIGRARPDMDVFSEDERRIIADFLREYRDTPTNRLVDLSHDLVWALRDDGETIPFEAYMAEIRMDDAKRKRAEEIIQAAELEYEN